VCQRHRAFATCSGGAGAAGSGGAFAAGSGGALAAGSGRCFCRWQRRCFSRRQRRCFCRRQRHGAFSLVRSTVHLSFAMAMAGAFAALRRPSRGRQAAPSALPGPAPAPLAAARCLHSLSLPDGPASIRSCSTPPLAASMPLALEGLLRSASGDGATKPRCGSPIFFQPPRGGKIFKVRSGCAALSKTFLSRFLSLDASAWLKDF